MSLSLSGRVLITGGSGFLGRAILRRARQEQWPATFTIYSRDETKQWELKHRYPEVRCVLGDVARDLPRLIAAMTGHETVIHAAAVKYIPEAEWNVFEAVEVNVDGSRNVALAARAAGVETVVGISTDKASAPLNLYGATKMVMERLFSEANRLGPTRYVNVRYGNVVGSTGSVIPLFRRQIAEDGRISVTDPRMTRFWLGVDDAIDLILWAHENAQERPGWTFVDACPGMAIIELAATVWEMERRLTIAGESVPIAFTGIRPGEKLAESLFNDQEAPRVQHVYGRIKDREGFLLAPATERGRLPDIDISCAAYSSDQPVRWLDRAEMAALIRDAAGV